jgi:hypothetical protein
MKKIILMILFFCLIISSGYSVGIKEYKGKNYCAGLYGGVFAVAYSIKMDMKEYDLTKVINDNKLYFIGLVAPSNRNEIIKRGYIQNGDKFLLNDDYPNVLATYTSTRRDIKNSTIISDVSGVAWGVGYAIYGGEIIILELIINENEYKTLEDNLKDIE